MHSRGIGKNVEMYDDMLKAYRGLTDPVILYVHPNNYDTVKNGLDEAKARNDYWPDILLYRDPYLTEGVIVWMKKPVPPTT